MSLVLSGSRRGHPRGYAQGVSRGSRNCFRHVTGWTAGRLEVVPESPTTSADWPGKRLGLPDSGSRSIGRLGRRIGALAIDFAAAALISAAFFQYDGWASTAVFAVVQIVFLLTLSGSPGHLLLGMRVVPLAGGYLGVWRPFTRTILLCLVIPALIWDKDQRGMHDRLSGTVLVRR